ncbi:hypothetical protein DM56_4810 [Burkholderia mallei]|nr:hypothetical protein DM75_4224 [Burkholderia mallei]KOS95154.1 hypothetical protein DM45_4056 [Burkholderia mallei]KOS99218.1 hypothetical protein DM49_4175 [Burkholderia mallei]KOT02686.1 hypothetical protein DM50_4114 [Burkholderia mallei]KOT12004.1 hypothetical protein DM56_4810 [Burkholderia mallei]
MRAPSGRAPPSYLPDSEPNASGEYASSPMRSRWLNSDKPFSNVRFSRLYGFWMLTMRGRPSFSAARRNCATPHGVSFDTPTWRTLPALTKSPRTASVSSIGTVYGSSIHGYAGRPNVVVLRSGQCSWYKST